MQRSISPHFQNSRSSSKSSVYSVFLSFCIYCPCTRSLPLPIPSAIFHTECYTFRGGRGILNRGFWDVQIPQTSTQAPFLPVRSLRKLCAEVTCVDRGARYLLAPALNPQKPLAGKIGIYSAWSLHMTCIWPSVPQTAGRVTGLSGVSLVRARIPFRRAPLSLPNCLPKSPPPDVITWWLGLRHMKLEGWDLNIQTNAVSRFFLLQNPTPTKEVTQPWPLHAFLHVLPA